MRDIETIEEAINSWLDGMGAPSEITSYINKFKGSLIYKIQRSIEFRNKKETNEEILKKKLNEILNNYEPLKRNYALHGKMPVIYFRDIYNEIKKVIDE